ncbi:conserved membrane hypothetical protein [Tenacibaculum amylolyticum]
MLKVESLLREKHMKKHFFIAFTGIILGVFIGYYMLISEQKTPDTIVLIGTGILGIVIAYSNVYLSAILDHKVPWKKHEGTRLLTGITMHLVITFLLSILGYYVYALINGQQVTITNQLELVFIKLSILLCILSIIYQVVYFAFYSYNSYVHLQIATITLERKQYEYQLNALKSQLGPHFLFNGLNTISSLIHKDVSKANLFIRKLALMYNYTLKSYHTKHVSLEEEIAFVESYNFLLETRFDKRYSCEIAITSEVLRTKIPPLTLQMLVENAVKHNVMSTSEPLKVTITNDEAYIYVENNITEVPHKVHSLKIGLRNINQRYLLLFKKGITITNGSNFRVKLPIVA